MALLNPNDSSEVLYGSSGDVRNEINSHVAATTAGHYADENEIPGSLIIASLRKATRMINGFLEPVYADQLPFLAIADVPKLIDEIGSDMATYYVFRSASVLLGRLPDEKKEAYYDQYVDAETGFLVRIADSKIQLPELTAITPLEAKSIRTLGRHPVFDVDDIKNQEVDYKLLEDIERERE